MRMHVGMSKVLRHLACTVGLVVALAACSAGNDEAAEPRAVAWHEVGGQTDENGEIWLPGSLQAANRSELSFEVPGIVASVRAEIGDPVQRGEVLATLDGRTYQLETARAEARLAETTARLRAAEQDAQRQAELLEAGAASESRYETAVAERSGLREIARAQRAEIGIARESLSDTNLRAPFSGRIARRAIEPGQQVGSGQVVFEIDGTGGVEATFSVTANQRQRLTVGTPVRVRGGRAGEAVIAARISEISGRGNASGLFEVTATLDGAPASFSPGSTVDIALPASGGGATGTAIPITALIPMSSNRARVFVIDPETGEIAARDIVIARLAGDDAIVRAGLSRGDLIVARGVAFLSEGQRVSRLGDGPQRFE